MGPTYILKSNPKCRFFEELLITNLFTLRVYAKKLLRGSHRRYMNLKEIVDMIEAKPFNGLI